MTVLNREVRAIQNPALGSALIWRAAVLYRKCHGTATTMPLPLAFLILPILFHEQTAELVGATRIASGLTKLTEKFRSAEFSRTDLLMSVASRANRMRPVTWEAIRLGLSANLLAIDTTTATLMPLTDTSHVAGVPAAVRPLLANAEKLGTWFAEMSLYEISLQFQVSF